MEIKLERTVPPRFHHSDQFFGWIHQQYANKQCPEVQVQVKISTVLFVELEYIILIGAQCKVQTQKECNHAASACLQITSGPAFCRTSSDIVRIPQIAYHSLRVDD